MHTCVRRTLDKSRRLRFWRVALYMEDVIVCTVLAVWADKRKKYQWASVSGDRQEH